MNRSSQTTWCLRLCLAVALCCGCSVDPSTHPQYRDGDDCPKNQEPYGIFCIPKKDAGKPEPDAGDEMPDAGPSDKMDSGPDVPKESCTPKDVDNCYPLKDVSTSQQAPCRAGARTCGQDGRWGECMGAIIPTAELCDGVDNDCDSRTDEEQVQKTCDDAEGALGECAKNGLAYCNAGAETCVARTKPVAETCNGKDDDCDGETDERLEVACYTAASGCTKNTTGGFDCVPASTCAPGKQRCIDGAMSGCLDQVGPQAERATAQNETPLDEDCDGKIDEGFACQNGQEFPCYTGPAETRGHSPCKDGKVTCNNGEFGTCMNQRTPEAETCANEGVDDDCDGVKDDVPHRGMSCSEQSGAQGVCKKTAVVVCEGGVEKCRDGKDTNEVCDGEGEDEDCDGKVDEGIDLQTDQQNCGSCKNRCAANLTCCGGSCVNTVTSNNFCGSCSKKCDTGLTCCSSNCINTQADANNCGTCGKSCLLGCSKGACNLL
ncbi:MAG TPA: MopE-related protein [Polyangiales bacterium]|nr:MopE-related protein [Polyangiales bacterium]